MSKHDGTSLPVIEWSGNQVALFDPKTRQVSTAPSIGQLPLNGAKQVVLALSRRTSFVRATRVPDVPKAQIAQVLQVQIGNLFPVPLAEIAFDFHLTKDVSDEGRLAIVAAVPTETLNLALRELRSAGLNAIRVLPTAFGSWLLAKSLSITQCAIVEHVGEGLAVDVVADDELRYTRVVPFPSSSEGIEAEVCRSFNIAKVACSHIVAAGGLAFKEAETQVTTRTLEMFGTPLAGRLDLNLELPEVVAARRKRASTSKARQAVLLSLGAVVCAALVFMDRSDASAKVAKADSYWQSRYSKAKTLEKAETSHLSTQETILSDLDLAFKPAQLAGDVVLTMSQETPANLWLTGFTHERGKPLLIRGTAQSSNDVAAYVQSLSGNQRFRDVKLVFANNAMIEKTPVVQFSISAHVIGNLPISNPFGTGGKK